MTNEYSQHENGGEGALGLRPVGIEEDFLQGSEDDEANASTGGAPTSGRWHRSSLTSSSATSSLHCPSRSPGRGGPGHRRRGSGGPAACRSVSSRARSRETTSRWWSVSPRRRAMTRASSGPTSSSSRCSRYATCPGSTGSRARLACSRSLGEGGLRDEGPQLRVGPAAAGGQFVDDLLHALDVRRRRATRRGGRLSRAPGTLPQDPAEQGRDQDQDGRLEQVPPGGGPQHAAAAGASGSGTASTAGCSTTPTTRAAAGCPV